MKLSIPLLGACLLAASTALYAQAPQTDAGKGQRFDCSKAKEPKRREERREKMKAVHSTGLKASVGQRAFAMRCFHLLAALLAALGVLRLRGAPREDESGA